MSRERWWARNKCRVRAGYALGVAVIVHLYSVPVFAAPAKFDVSGIYWGGVEFADQDLAVSRLTIRPQVKKRWGRKFQLHVAGELEWSNGDAGLGSVDAYAPLSKPIVRADHFRLELAQATLRYRAQNFSVTLGKQILAWGVLDGLRVADRADPVRRRDFVLAEQRPERLARWGIRSRGQVGQMALDAAVFFDSTADQLPTLGSSFFPQATRSLGGFSAVSVAALGLPPVAERSHGVAQATWGLKLGGRAGGFDIELLGLHGPDTEALIYAGVSALSGPDLELRYPTRSLLAVTMQRSLGSAVIRFEGAIIPDQSINLGVQGRTDKVRRVLAGAGVDMKVSGGWFVNAQIGIDSLERHRSGYARPRSDVVATLRVMRGFLQDRLSFKTELIGSPVDGDGYWGTALTWQLDDRVKAAIGADVLFGDNDALFGQFSDRSRGWIRLVYTP